jgi:hypothetical protein
MSEITKNLADFNLSGFVCFVYSQIHVHFIFNQIHVHFVYNQMHVHTAYQ